MKASNILAIGFGGLVLYSFLKNKNSQNTRQIHLPQVVNANNGGFVIYQGQSFSIQQINAQSDSLNLTASQAQMELDAGTQIGMAVELSIKRILGTTVNRFQPDGM